MGVSENFPVQHLQTILQLRQPGLYLHAVCIQQLQTLPFRLRPRLTQGRILEHGLQGHAGSFQATNKRQPHQHAIVVAALAARVALRIGQQAYLFVITQRVGRETATLRQFAYLHSTSMQGPRNTAT